MRSTAASERPSAGIVMTERALIVHGPGRIAVCSVCALTVQHGRWWRACHGACGPLVSTDAMFAF